MDKKKIKKWAVIVLGALVLIIAAQIIIKLLRTGTKSAESVIKVSAVTAKSSEIEEIVSIQGIAQGDPQVKVYPQVPGKFERVAAKEGSTVKKDDILLYINRDIVGMNFQLAPVKSPINGIVTRIYYSDRGAAVSPQYPVAEVTNPENIKVEMSIGEEEMVKVKAGMTAEIKPVYGGTVPLKAGVYSTTPYIDTDTMSGTIIVKAPNKDGVIKPGMSVTVDIFTGRRNAIMLPENAVLMGDAKTYVFINDNGTAKRIDFEAGYMSSNEAEAKSGITEGMTIITEGNFKLNDGSRIEVEAQVAEAQGAK